MSKTFYHTATDEAIGAYSATEEKAASLTAPAGSTDIAIGGIGTAGELVLTFITPSGEPNEADAWPSDVEVHIDVPTMDSTVSYGFMTLGSGAGGFARVTADGATELSRVEQAEDAFTTPGLKVATFSALPSGDNTDRGVAVMAAQKTFGHGNDSMSARADGDGIITGGWAGGTSGTPLGVVEGTVTISPNTVTSAVTILALTTTLNTEVI